MQIRRELRKTRVLVCLLLLERIRQFLGLFPFSPSSSAQISLYDSVMIMHM